MYRIQNTKNSARVLIVLYLNMETTVVKHTHLIMATIIYI